MDDIDEQLSLLDRSNYDSLFTSGYTIHLVYRSSTDDVGFMHNHPDSRLVSIKIFI